MTRRYKKRCECGAIKSRKFKFCYPCSVILKENYEAAIKAAAMNRDRNRQQKLLREYKKLPAKNRKKGKIIDALMAGVPLSQISTKKTNPHPKTILYRSLESALEEKRIESLFQELEKF